MSTSQSWEAWHCVEYNEAGLCLVKVAGHASVEEVTHYEEEATQQDQMPFTD